MNLVTEMPKNIQLLHCAKHGDYEMRFLPMGTKFFKNDYCPKCAVENNQKQRAEDAQLAKKQAADLVRRSRIEAGVSLRNVDACFDDYVPEEDHEAKNLASIKLFCNKIQLDGSGNMVMCGSLGTGKTLLMSATVNQLLASGKRCRIVKMQDLIRELKDCWRPGAHFTETQLIKKFASIDLLVIDEVGMGYGSDTEKLFIFDVIDGRYNNMLPTVLVSNLDITGVKEAVGTRVVDRLREDGGLVLAFTGRSRR
ncbi:ATP-binding protein [Rheinheimera salexigens]|uniref:IstB-like ATP-binding domain-containing protein n=1 Tax=Rheinheimera salexigens TaxID=1628148 RepID=A0A1E7Q834_9GAMM|nr:ATP-binding protein [Rheinheimera salexigens]OEY70354.1 hypothetical protein BI198_12805 [Rheinheimera salexigens]